MDKWFTFNAVRHSSVTFIHKHFPELAESLAQQMSHSVQTARSQYKNKMAPEVAQEGFKDLRKAFSKKLGDSQP